VQLPLGTPQVEAALQSPLSEPRAGDTVVLFKIGERSSAYAVGPELGPRPITPGQFVSVVVCEAQTPRAALPADTNARVMAAYEAVRRDAAGRLGRARRPLSDTRSRRYVSRELRTARQSYAENAEELRHIDILRQIFLDQLPANVLRELQEIQRMELTGNSLIRRLDALRERHRLNPQEADETPSDGAAHIEVVRIICSDGLRQ
jgi:hypothetical protein